MAAKKNKAIEVLIKKFVSEVQRNISVTEIFLFGSYACGKADKGSDIDIIVVSPAFSRGNRMRHMQYLFRKASRIGSLLEPISASPSDIRHADKREFLGAALATAKCFCFDESLKG